LWSIGGNSVKAGRPNQQWQNTDGTTVTTKH